MATIRIDGVDYEVGSSQYVQAREKHDREQQTRIDSLMAENTKLKTDLGSETKRADTEKKRADDEKARADKASDPKTLHAAIKRRADLLDKARRVASRLGVRFDAEDEEKLAEGESDDSVLVKILEMVEPDFKPAGKDPVFIQGYAMAKIEELLKAGEDEEGEHEEAEHESAEEDATAGREVEGPGGALPAPAPGRSDSIHGARRTASQGERTGTRRDSVPQDPRKRNEDAWQSDLAYSVKR